MSLQFNGVGIERIKQYYHRGMENIIFSLNSTMPVFLMMLLGVLFRRVGIMDEGFANRLSKFVFTIALPFVLFRDLAVIDFKSAWDFNYVLFCFMATLFSIMISTLVSFLFKDHSVRGEFIQASYRSSATILGIAFIQSMYSTTGMGPLMVLGCAPLYNIFAVIVLSLFKPGERGISKEKLKRSFLGIVKNPILIAIAIGLVWSFIGIPLKGIVYKTVSNVGATATPLGVIAMGASLDFKRISGNLKPAIVAAIFKLLLFVSIFAPIAYFFGFRNEALVAIIVMLGSATTVASFVMAKNMGYEGAVTSATIAMTTLLSAFTLTFWFFLFRTLGAI